MTIKIYPIRNDLRKIVQKLVEKFGVPEARKDMAIYYKKCPSGEIHLRFRNKKCLMIFIDPQTDELFRPKIHVDSEKTDIKSLFIFLKKLGFNNASIGIATCLSFYSKNQVFIELMTDTFIGDFLQLGFDDELESEDLRKFIESTGLTPMDSSTIGKEIKKVNPDYEQVVDSLNVLNYKIFDFTKEIGLNVDSTGETLRNSLENFNNDYGYIEKSFNLIFNKDFLGYYGLKEELAKNFSPVSIIIPSYNSEKSLLKTLLSIESQDIPKEALSKVDVIVIDDGSTVSVKKIIDQSKKSYTFILRTIRLDPNLGLSSARNAGISQALNDILIFLDSDIILSKNYLLEHSIRNCLVPNAIFVSFKQNVEYFDSLISDDRIEKGLDKPDISRDMRIEKVISGDAPGLYEISGKVAVEILSASNYFKDFSYGRSIGIFDLPSMVIGHNMSCRKNLCREVNGFSNYFKGWGLEDSFFGAKIIAKGNFVIPVVSCGVYHINHPPRSGSEDQKRKELEANMKKYVELLCQPLDK